MNEKIDQCIVNCLSTDKGSLPMFRSFGIGAVDQTGRIRRSQIQEQLSTYYPSISDLDVQQIDETTYKVSVRGRYYEAQ